MNISGLQAYELLQQETLTDIRSEGYLLRHKKSGARIMLIKNEDDNKVFNIAFRTTPSDSTGVAHIIEHTVLCGSEKYPSKDPFVELVKGSMNTFLNAMTYPDKTMYPVASCNDQDFRNLMDVYLDAVFHPNIYRNELIFRQEGWSYQLEDAEDELVYNGVVYNEMKGAYSSPDDVLERQIMASLFPDTTYGVDSGGDPECIPDLTYEAYLDFHRTYYHPCNSWIYLYGNMDFEERLIYLDREYLSKYDAVKSDTGVKLQKSFTEPVALKTRYPIGENDPLTDHTYLTYNVVIGESTDTRLTGACAVLEYVLLEASGAPLKKALLDAGIGKDVYGSYDSGIRQPVFSIVAKNANESDKERFRGLIRETLTKLAEEGLNPKSLEAAINSMEFKYREADFGGYPKGLFYSIDVLDSWLHREDLPFAYLKQIEDYRFLREQIGTGYYESLIRTYFLENPHASFLISCPARGIVAEAEAAAGEKLARFRASLSQEEEKKLILETEKLRIFQETPSSQEELEKIPMLERKDLKRKVRPFHNHEYEKSGVILVHHDYQTNGIAYITLLLDASSIPQEEYPYLGILKNVLGEVDTEHYSYDDLSTEINRRTGGIVPGISIFQHPDDAKCMKAALGLKIAVLPGEIGFAFEIAKEILFSSKLRDEKRLREILQRLKTRTYAHLTSAGHSTAAGRAMSGFSAENLFSDAIGGVTFYQTLAGYENAFDEKKEELEKKLETVLGRLLKKDGFLVSFTGDEQYLDGIMDQAVCLAGGLQDGDSGKTERIAWIRDLRYTVRREGFLNPSKVQYVAQAGTFSGSGLSYTGALAVLKVILDYDYLWTNLRVVGGAYGCGSSFGRNGSSVFYSYRDPHLRNTLRVISGIADYVKDFSVDERDMTKYVIGTVSGFDTPLTPRTAGIRSLSAWVTGVETERLQKERDQVLDATAEDIRALQPYLEAILESSTICAVGSEEKLNSEKDLFDRVLAL